MFKDSSLFYRFMDDEAAVPECEVDIKCFKCEVGLRFVTCEVDMRLCHDELVDVVTRLCDV